MLDVRSVACSLLAAAASQAAADDAATNIRRLERGLLTAALVDANRLTTEFHSANGRFTLSDQLNEMILIDSETQESTALPFLPERTLPRE